MRIPSGVPGVNRCALFAACPIAAQTTYANGDAAIYARTRAAVDPQACTCARPVCRTSAPTPTQVSEYCERPFIRPCPDARVLSWTQG